MPAFGRWVVVCSVLTGGSLGGLNAVGRCCTPPPGFDNDVGLGTQPDHTQMLDVEREAGAGLAQ